MFNCVHVFIQVLFFFLFHFFDLNSCMVLFSKGFLFVLNVPEKHIRWVFDDNLFSRVFFTLLYKNMFWVLARIAGAWQF